MKLLHCWHFFAYICNRYLSWVFAVAICGMNLLQLFPVGKQTLYVSKTFFIYEDFFINSVSFCYYLGSYEPP